MKNKRDGETYYPHHVCPETPLNSDYFVDNKNRLGVGELPPKTLISIKTTKEDFKRDYTLRGRIGIHILRIIGVVTLEITNK